MGSEIPPASDPDNIPAYWPPNYALSAKDALAWASMLAFLLVPMLLALYGVGVWFGTDTARSTRGQTLTARDWQFLAASVILAGGAGWAGKYLWLIAMCRILSRSNVGPLVAYGQPRRIARFDRALIVRLYKTSGPAQTTRLRPLILAGRLYRLLGIVYAIAALLAFGIGLLPLMHKSPPSWPLALCFVVLALFFFGLGHWMESKKR